MKDSEIKEIKAREIMDSRGNPTVAVEVLTAEGSFNSSVPSGASRGKHEAVELRDGDKRYQGRGVLKAVSNINEIIASKLRDEEVTNQKRIDEILLELDGRDDKSKLGGNSICGVSLAVCRAGAAAKNISLYQYIREIFNFQTSILNLPKPCFNIINGGAHAGNELDFQEFMIVPDEDSFANNLRIGAEIYHQLKKILAEQFGREAKNIGDEGGFAPSLRIPEEAIELISKAAVKLNYEKKINLILDVASSQFFKDSKYRTNMGIFTREGLIRYYLKLISNYSILGLEDPFSEDDWEGWEMMMSNARTQMPKLLIIGDDLTVTNPKRIKLAEKKKACNAIIVKINQIGTVSEAIEAVKLAQSLGWKIIVSNRSGETCDDFISDFAVGVGADFIKAGAPARGERVAKYNRLLKIEEEIDKM